MTFTSAPSPLRASPQHSKSRRCPHAPCLRARHIVSEAFQAGAVAYINRYVSCVARRYAADLASGRLQSYPTNSPWHRYWADGAFASTLASAHDGRGRDITAPFATIAEFGHAPGLHMQEDFMHLSASQRRVITQTTRRLLPALRARKPVGYMPKGTSLYGDVTFLAVLTCSVAYSRTHVGIDVRFLHVDRRPRLGGSPS